VAPAVLAGLDRDESPASLRRLIDSTGIGYDTDFLPSSQLRYASGALCAAAGDHAAALEELRGCARDEPGFGGENPAMLPWRSATALSLAELGRSEEARALAADEVRRAESSVRRARSGTSVSQARHLLPAQASRCADPRRRLTPHPCLRCGRAGIRPTCDAAAKRTMALRNQPLGGDMTGMDKQKHRPLDVAVITELIALVATTSAGAFQALPPGNQVNNDSRGGDRQRREGQQ
jgi:hypothetical protein